MNIFIFNLQTPFIGIVLTFFSKGTFTFGTCMGWSCPGSSRHKKDYVLLFWMDNHISLSYNKKIHIKIKDFLMPQTLIQQRRFWAHSQYLHSRIFDVFSYLWGCKGSMGSESSRCGIVGNISPENLQSWALKFGGSHILWILNTGVKNLIGTYLEQQACSVSKNHRH